MTFGRIELLKKLAGKRVQLSTVCGTFREEDGRVKDVFDDFFVFMTTGGGSTMTQRNMVMLENIGVVTQLPEVETEALEITR